MILLVRGDLQSETGWGRATRALLAAIDCRFKAILGIDLHYHPNRSIARFPYPLVDPNTVASYSPLMDDLVVLHACHPDLIEWMPGAINVGWWFWETDQIRTDFDWKERLDVLDVLFVPSDWHAAWIAARGIQTPTVVLQWPFDLKVRSLPVHVKFVDAFRLFDRHALIALTQPLPGRTTGDPLAMLREHAERFNIGSPVKKSYAIAVQSDAPRKGLACLLSEWRGYRAAGGLVELLLIRFSGLNVDHDACALLATLSRIALSASRGDETAFADVRAVVDHIPDSTLFSAYAGATAMITPTFGEGFGGTIVEAAQAGTVVIAPQHTACKQLLPIDYPLAYASSPYVGALIGQSTLIPSNSTWHLPRPGSITAALARLDSMSTQERDQASSMLFNHLGSLLAPARIASIFTQGIAQIQQRRRAA